MSRYESGEVPMLRFWFCVYREDPLFHLEQTCQHLKGRPRSLEDFPSAEIPIDSNEVGSESELRMCPDCVPENVFDKYYDE